MSKEDNVSLVCNDKDGNEVYVPFGKLDKELQVILKYSLIGKLLSLIFGKEE